MITCNVFTHRPVMLATILKAITGYFDIIRVLVSSEDRERLKGICKRFGIAEVYDKEFISQAERFNYLLQYTNVGDWFYMCHDDEIPSIALLENIDDIVSECECTGYDSIAPALLYEVDYHPEMNLRDFITSRMIYVDKSIALKHNIQVPEYLFMRRFFKMKPETHFDNFVHEALHPYAEAQTKLIAYPLIHRKISGGYIASTVRQSTYYIRNGTSIFTYPIVTGQPQTENDKIILSILEDESLVDINSIERRFLTGTISPLMKHWILENKNSDSPYVFAWYIMYFLKYHPEQAGDLDKRLLNLWINHNLAAYDTLPTINSTLHPFIKDYLLSNNIAQIKRGENFSE